MVHLKSLFSFQRNHGGDGQHYSESEVLTWNKVGLWQPGQSELMFRSCAGARRGMQHCVEAEELLKAWMCPHCLRLLQ